LQIADCRLQIADCRCGATDNLNPETLAVRLSSEPEWEKAVWRTDGPSGSTGRRSDLLSAPHGAAEEAGSKPTLQDIGADGGERAAGSILS
jgi:hypothetical protein